MPNTLSILMAKLTRYHSGFLLYIPRTTKIHMWICIIFVTNNRNLHVDSYCIRHERHKSTCRSVPFNTYTIGI